MGKRKYFSILKLALCYLVFAATVGVFGVIVDVPTSITNESGKEFYVEHDKERNLWFCMELVTMNNRDWWYGRIAYERSILYKCCARETEGVEARLLECKKAIQARIDELKRDLSAKEMDTTMNDIIHIVEIDERRYGVVDAGLKQLRSTGQLDSPAGKNFCELIALTSVSLENGYRWMYDKSYLLFIKDVMSRCKMVETYLTLKYFDTNITKWLETGNFEESSKPCAPDSVIMGGAYGEDYWNAKIGGDNAFMSLADYARSSPLCSDFIKYREGYRDVFNGFVYNLEDYAKGGSGSTWVAYVSSRPVNGPLYLEGSFDSASSPDIKMAVTVKISDPFYSPLGIFRSLISKAYDNKNGLAEVKNLSMFLHSFIARTVCMIRPGIKYMVFRPRALMLDIIKKSGIKYTVSKDGETQNVALPYVGFSLSKYDDMTGYNILTALFLVDPHTDTRYNFSNSHWFFTSPYLGRFSKQQLAKFPFIVIDLAEYSNTERAGERDHSLATAHTSSQATITVTSVNPRVNVTISPVTASSAGENRQVPENTPPQSGSEANYLPFENCRMSYKWGSSVKPTICTEPPSISVQGKIPSGVLFRLPVTHFNKGDRISMRGNIREGKIEFGLAFADEHGWVCANALEFGAFDSTVIVPVDGKFLPLFMCDKNLGIDATITGLSLH